MADKELEQDWDDDEEILPGLEEMLVAIATDTFDTHKKFWYGDNITEEQRKLYMTLPRNRELH
jgi:hypothetical protein